MARIFMSSAKMKVGLKVWRLGRTFIKMQKSKGPSREPCGTPLVTCNSLFEAWSSRRTYFLAELSSLKGCLGHRCHIVWRWAVRGAQFQMLWKSHCKMQWLEQLDHCPWRHIFHSRIAGDCSSLIFPWRNRVDSLTKSLWSGCIAVRTCTFWKFCFQCQVEIWIVSFRRTSDCYFCTLAGTKPAVF